VERRGTIGGEGGTPTAEQLFLNSKKPELIDLDEVKNRALAQMAVCIMSRYRYLEQEQGPVTAMNTVVDELLESRTSMPLN